MVSNHEKIKEFPEGFGPRKLVEYMAEYDKGKKKHMAPADYNRQFNDILASLKKTFMKDETKGLDIK